MVERNIIQDSRLLPRFPEPDSEPFWQATLDHELRYRIPLIAITAGADSVLAGESDLALILPPAPEACPMGLAPTTSTSMMMALGDALAITLLERNGFSAQDFQVLHPGGQLGGALLRVADVMQRPETLPLCDEATPMAEALLIMTRSSGDLRSFGS